MRPERVNPLNIIEKYYATDTELWSILVGHSSAVAAYALTVCQAHPELNVDRSFIYEASMLHDIGIVRCDAPSIHCRGTLPYICHGIAGAEMLREIGLERHARVCERHTGAGLSARDISEQGLPLPPGDYLPLTPEEEIVCYADKFFSKSRELAIPKSLDRARHSVGKHGRESLERFEALHSKYHL